MAVDLLRNGGRSRWLHKAVQFAVCFLAVGNMNRALTPAVPAGPPASQRAAGST
jgi:hypothetical protein